MVNDPENWPWSSYRATVGLDVAAPWLAVNGLLVQFAKERTLAQRRYKKFVFEGIAAASPWLGLKGQIYLGGSQFVQGMQANFKVGKEDVQIPFVQRHPLSPSLDSLHQQSPDRNSAIIAAYATGAYSYQQIAAYFGLHFTTVGKIVRRNK